MLRVFVGFDPRETATYHVLSQSIIERTSVPVALTPLHRPMLDGFDGQKDGTNAFIYSRFLVPELCGFSGWALYMDSDMLALADIAELWALRDDSKAVMVCPHEYETKVFTKLIGTPMQAANAHYPRKNHSSLMLWNCGHPANGVLNRQWVHESTGQFLHRFKWLAEWQIGSLPLQWNWLVGEYPRIDGVKVAHYTLGAPGFKNYSRCDYSTEWHRAFADAQRMDNL